MILDLQKISKLETKYSSSQVALTALHNMVGIVSSNTCDASELVNTVPYLTLLDLGVIKGLSKPAEQLNS
jgi:hypothetical protein